GQLRTVLDRRGHLQSTYQEQHPSRRGRGRGLPQDATRLGPGVTRGVAAEYTQGTQRRCPGMGPSRTHHWKCPCGVQLLLCRDHRHSPVPCCYGSSKATEAAKQSSVKDDFTLTGAIRRSWRY